MRNKDAPGEGVRPGLSTDPRAAFSERRLAAWVGGSVRVEGRVISTEDLTIDGHVEGGIELGNRSLTVGPGATIKADVVARNVTISGAVTGNVRASEHLELQATGSVVGDIVAPQLVMAEGAVITGKVDVAGGRKTSAT